MKVSADTSTVESQQETSAGLDSVVEVGSNATATESSQDVVVKEQETPKSGLEAVKAALSDSTEPGDPDSQSDSTIRAGKEGEETAKPGDESDTAEPANLSPKGRENWKRLQADRDQWAGKAQQFEQKAKAYDQITGMVKQTGLDAQEIDSALSIAALVRHDPAAALKELSGVVDSLRRIVGEVLPQDIQAMVDDGSMTEAAARQFARARYEADHAKVNVQRVQQSVEQRQQQERQQSEQQFVEHTGEVLTQWENRWKASDPDYPMKQSLVRSRVVELVQERGKPRNVDEAIQLAEDARNDINQQLRSVIQRTRQPVRTVTGGTSTGVVPAKPSSPIEAARAALGL